MLQVNGYQCHASAELMSEHFRTELGYEGFFASDAGNVAAMVNARVAFNTTDAAAIALSAGMDQTMGGGLDPSVTLPAVSPSGTARALLARATDRRSQLRGAYVHVYVCALTDWTVGLAVGLLTRQRDVGGALSGWRAGQVW